MARFQVPPPAPTACLHALHFSAQVADDILDVTASTEELGKTAGKDLDADKTTYPKLLGLDRSREVRLYHRQ